MNREELLSKHKEPIRVLDQGFVRLVDVMGGDDAIVQAARVSYGQGTKKGSEDRSLIRYLVRQRHTTPLEMCEIKFHCKMPIFVARQWIRHRTANVNELSGRYSELPAEFYVPAPDQVCHQDKKNKQGRSEPMDTDDYDAAALFDRGPEFASYEKACKAGMSREMARIGLPLSTYTEWYWKIDLHNLMHFLGLRLDGHAQYEIRVFAEAMAAVVADWVPHAWEAFVDYRRDAVTLSRQEVEVVRKVIEDLRIYVEEEARSEGADVTSDMARQQLLELMLKRNGLDELSSKREREEFLVKFCEYAS